MRELRSQWRRNPLYPRGMASSKFPRDWAVMASGLVWLTLGTARCTTYSATPDPDAGSFPVDDATAPDDSLQQSDDAQAAKDGASSDTDASANVDSGGSDGGDGSVVVQGACAMGQRQLGEYSTWSGKVNVHRAAGGSWLVDSDCSSGVENNTIAYCKKFWPTTTVQVHLASVNSDTKPFTQGGGTAPICGGLAPNKGVDQYACCAPQ